ncbi:MAG: hypothetical protein O7C63_08820 [Alphaproteobacteria bacterium]|nr:hypothetical protein [Alphaproteobacteria bacterium]
MEKVAYAILLVLAGLWLLAMVGGMIAAFPLGILGLLVLVAFGLLFAKVLRERMASEEDDYYSKTIEK